MLFARAAQAPAQNDTSWHLRSVVMCATSRPSAVLRAYRWSRARSHHVIASTARSAAAALLTPLGFGIVVFVFGMSNEADISEWEPAWRSMPAGLVFGAVALLT